MLRFIVKVTSKEELSGAECERMFTLDADVPALEAQLTRGGFSQYGYEVAHLVGVEVLTGHQGDQA